MSTETDMYDEGYKDGLTAYAWWKDGGQFVGTTGTLLSRAIEERESLWNYRPHHAAGRLLDALFEPEAKR